jgi:hypothetical protein
MTTGAPRHFVLGRPLRSARYRPGDTPASQADVAWAGREIRELFGKLGLKLHPTKTDLQGMHALELLGILVDTRRQLYLLSPSKLAKISQAARLFRMRAIRHKRRCSLRDIQRFVDLEIRCALRSQTPACTSGPLSIVQAQRPQVE